MGPVDLTNITGAEKSREYGSPVHGWSCIWRNNGIGRAWVDWVIAGGESGPRSRLMHIDWVRSLRDQCQAAGVAFHFKQWGQYLPAGQQMADGRLWNPGCGSTLRAVKGITGRTLDGREWNEFPGETA